MVKVITPLNWLDEHTYRMTGYKFYKAYLKSDHWLELREKALKRAKNRCELCNEKKRLQAHHKTYDHLGNELLSDIIVLCNDCHTIFTVRRRARMKKKMKERNQRMHVIYR